MTKTEFLNLFKNNKLNIRSNPISAKIRLKSAVNPKEYMIESQNPELASENGIIRL